MSVSTSRYSHLFYISILSVLSLMFIFTAYGHASGEEVKKEVNEAAEDIGAYTIEQKDAAVAKARELMEKLDKKTDALESSIEGNWDNLKQSTRENYQKSLKELRKQRNALSEWYGSMKHSSKEAWGEVKRGFSDTYDRLENAYKDTEDQTKTEK